MTESIYQVAWNYSYRGWESQGVWYSVTESEADAVEKFRKTKQFREWHIPELQELGHGKWNFEDYHCQLSLEAKRLEEIVVSLEGLGEERALKMTVDKGEGWNIRVRLEKRP